MSYLVMVVLSLLWLGFFLPGLLEARRSSPLASASTFQEALTRIATGRAVDAGAAPAPAVRRRPRRDVERRRDVLAGLTAVVLATAVLALVFGGAVRWLMVPAVLALGGYVAMLRGRVVQARAAAHRHGTRSRPPAARPVPVRERVGSAPGRQHPVGDLERIAG